MRSPYEPPQSNLYTQETEKRSIWWKIYFYFICFLIILNANSTFFDNEIDAYDYLSNAVNFICGLGLFGFVFNRKIFIAKFWFIFSFFAALESLMVREIYEQTFNMTLIELGSLFIAFLVSMPMFIGIFIYSRSMIWNNDKVT